MDQDRLRIQYLESKEGLSHEEMQELIKLKPPGTFVELPNASTLGIKDLDRQVQNLKERPGRIFHALSNGCYIEAIALRAQYLEIWFKDVLGGQEQTKPSFRPERQNNIRTGNQ